MFDTQRDDNFSIHTERNNFIRKSRRNFKFAEIGFDNALRKIRIAVLQSDERRIGRRFAKYQVGVGKMIVIADTTPIITLIKLQRLELLEKLFGSVMIPSAVYNELTKNPRFEKETEIVRRCNFLKVQNVIDRQSIKFLREIVGLDAGESEAIALSDEHSADLLVIDERKGRKAAQKLGLKIIGTIGILIQAFDSNLISKSEIISCVEKLRESDIRIGENLIEIVLEHVE